MDLKAGIYCIHMIYLELGSLLQAPLLISGDWQRMRIWLSLFKPWSTLQEFLRWGQGEIFTDFHLGMEAHITDTDLNLGRAQEEVEVEMQTGHLITHLYHLWEETLQGEATCPL